MPSSCGAVSGRDGSGSAACSRRGSSDAGSGAIGATGFAGPTVRRLGSIGLGVRVAAGALGFALVRLLVLARLLLPALQQALPVGDRDLVVVGVDFAEGQEAVAVAAIFDEGGLQAGLYADDFGEVDVAFELLLGRGLDVEVFEAVTVQHHHAGFFRVRASISMRLVIRYGTPVRRGRAHAGLVESGTAVTGGGMGVMTSRASRPRPGMRAPRSGPEKSGLRRRLASGIPGQAGGAAGGKLPSLRRPGEANEPRRANAARRGRCDGKRARD